MTNNDNNNDNNNNDITDNISAQAMHTFVADPANLNTSTVGFSPAGFDLDRLAQAMAAEENTLSAGEESAAEISMRLEAQAEAQIEAEIAEDKALSAQLAEEQALEAALTDEEIKSALPTSLDLDEIASCIEAILFISDKSVSAERLIALLELNQGENGAGSTLFNEAMDKLRARYQAVHHGIEIVEVAGGFQFRTKPGRAALAKKLSKVQTQRLSSGAMETLAITAYRQPVMKEEIDKIRGVDSSYFIRGLMDKKLIEISGRSELPGRPMLYSTTREFLELFGLKDTSSLPSLVEVEKMIPNSQVGQSAENEQDSTLSPEIKKMRTLVNSITMDTSMVLGYNPAEDEKILKEIREKVNSVRTTTPFLEQKAAEEARIAEEARLAAQANLTPKAQLSAQLSNNEEQLAIN